MGRIPEEEAERYNKRRFLSYKYYDTPDGEDLFPKLLYTNKFAVLFGLPLGLVDSFRVVPFALTHKERFFRIAKWVVPAVGVASAFTFTTFYATKLRGDVDEFNYVLGGIAAGSIVGALAGRISAGCYASIFFGSIAYCKKYHELRNTKVSARRKGTSHLAPYYKRKLDFSLLPNDIRGNWTREPQK